MDWWVAWEIRPCQLWIIASCINMWHVSHKDHMDAEIVCQVVLVSFIIIVLCIAYVLVLFGMLKAISISWSSILERKRINWMMFGKQYVLDETFSKFALTFLCLIQDFKYQLTSAIHLLTDTIFRKGNCLTIISTVYFRCTASTAKI